MLFKKDNRVTYGTLFGCPLIGVKGPFNQMFPGLVETVSEKVQEGSKNLVIDLREVTLFTSIGISCMVAALKKVTAADGRVFLLGAMPDMVDLLSLVGIHKIFVMINNEDELKAALEKKS